LFKKSRSVVLDFAVGVFGHDFIYEVQKLKSPTAVVMYGFTNPVVISSAAKSVVVP